jgi:hypothetical protein
MPGGSISISDSHSDTESLLPSKHGKEQSDKPSSKQPAPAIKLPPRVATKKESASILSSTSGTTGKSQVGQASISGKAKPANGKSPFGNHSQKQLTTRLLDEVSASWDDTEYDVIPLFQGQKTSTGTSANAQPKVASKPVFKGNPSSGPASLGNKPSSIKKPGNTGGQIAPRNASLATDEHDSSIVESSTDGSGGNYRTNKARSGNPANSGAPGSAQGDRKLDSAPMIRKLRQRVSQGGLVSLELVEAERANRKNDTGEERIKRLNKATLQRISSHRTELMELMTGESTDENAEELYQKVAEICTDKKLENWQKLHCLLGKFGQPCNTLKTDVNAYFDAWVIEKYLENHAPKMALNAEKRKQLRDKEESERLLAEKERKRLRDEEERKKLLSKKDGNGNDDGNTGESENKETKPEKLHWLWEPADEEREVLNDFKAALNWWERWKIDHIKPVEKRKGIYFLKKRELQRIELLRKMQKRLTAEERAFIRAETKTYHDLLANSGLPLLHIAIKNESVELVRAYLLAVTAFAPLDIKKEAIQATQHQGLQAFYQAMTHSTTTMIKMFMETVLKSEFLFYEHKEEILHARRPDKLRNGTYGIGAFYMAMGLGDMARADAFMSTLLAWDPNCKIEEYSEMKVNLLLGKKSFHSSDMAKHAAREHGHKKLVKRYDQFLNSSHLSCDQKDELYYCERGPIPKSQVQPEAREWTEQDAALKQLIWETFGFPEDVNKLEDPHEVSPGVFLAYRTKRERRLIWENRRKNMLKNGETLPEDLQTESAENLVANPFGSLRDAGDYARLSTFPKPVDPQTRRTDGDIFIGVPPVTSKQAKENTWEARANSGTLPPRSSSYASGLARLPAAPSSLPIIPRLDDLTPKKRTPSPESRTGQQTSLPDRTPTRLVSGGTPKLPQSDSGNSPGGRKDLRWQRPDGTGSRPGTPKTGTPIPT